MSTKFTFLLGILFPVFLLGQIDQTLPDETSVLTFRTKSIDYSDVKANGSPFLDEEYKAGEVIINGKVTLRGKLRYNAHRSEVEVLEKDDTSFSLLKRSYISAKIGSKAFKIFTYKEGDLERTAYFNPLNEGETVLLFKPEVKLKSARIPSTNYDRYSPPTYIEISSYYLKKGKDSAEKIRLKKKDILALLSDKSAALKSFISEQNLKLKQEEDMIKLVDHYNSLL
ncbi:MAG: hypothetical protein WBG90_14070 [Saonia sp.]